MGKIVGHRSLNQLTWAVEDESGRATRRAPLCELDGLLTQLEDVNVRGIPVPGRLRLALHRHGIVMGPRDSAADMIEAIFCLQERYMLRPEPTVHVSGRPTDTEELRRRLAG